MSQPPYVHPADLPASDPRAASAALSIDDCWNRIGVRGDASCPQLPQHIDCRNCPVQSRAAVDLLDRLPADAAPANGEPAPHLHHHADGEFHSWLLFRLCQEWLALPTVLLEEVAEQRVIHSLPHRRSPIVSGLANIRGTLVVCVSLAALLGIADSHAAPSAAAHQRMLVVRRDGQTTAFGVDEVHGTLRVAETAYKAVPTTFDHGTAHFTHAVMAWNDKTVGLLNEERLFHALDRSLA
ncbi:chemotaxis protein CheW [Paraherbaspirillum soli]|uniref:Chemotaxis protein CheW n=1 Tax=Paraherbaspirillum soli TaxID=631222 RepID=A0ABW0M6J2_9BURK